MSKNLEKVMKTIEVMMVKSEEINGKKVHAIKMLDLNEDVMEYAEISSSVKVKEIIKGKIKDS